MIGRHTLGIDLGTVNTLIYMQGKGIVLREPSIIAENSETGEIAAFGHEAQKLMERTPEKIVSVRPIQDGVVADQDKASAMLRYFLGKVLDKRGVLSRLRLRKQNVLVSIPIGVTSVEKRAIQEAIQQAGVQQVYTIAVPFAAALGAGLPLREPVGSMIVSIGGGSIGAAVLSYAGIVSSSSIRVAGDEMDEAIIHYIHKKHNMLIGKSTAEALKIDLGYALQPEENETKEIQGRDIITDLPKITTISAGEMYEALAFVVPDMIEVIQTTLAKTPPELVSDLIDLGMVLTGGGVLLRKMSTVLSREINIPVHIAEQPLDCVVLGTAKAVRYPHLVETI